MSTVDTFTTPEDGWSMVSHYLGNILLVVRSVIKRKESGWETKVAERRTELSSKLRKIAVRLAQNEHTEDSQKIDQLRKMVEDGDFSSSTIIDEIHAKHHELDEGIRAFKEKLKELENKKR